MTRLSIEVATPEEVKARALARRKKAISETVEEMSRTFDRLDAQDTAVLRSHAYLTDEDLASIECIMRDRLLKAGWEPVTVRVSRDSFGFARMTTSSSMPAPKRDWPLSPVTLGAFALALASALAWYVL